MVVFHFTVNGESESINRDGEASVVSAETLLYKAGYRPTWWLLYEDTSRLENEALSTVDLNEIDTFVARPKSGKFEEEDFYGEYF